MKKGFTLAELLITIVILAVLAAIALPNFRKSSDKANAYLAVATLRSIRAAEQAYFAKNGTYWLATNPTANDFRTNLGVEIAPSNYYFNVIKTAFTQFNAQANKGSTPVISCVFVDCICVSDNGTWMEGSPYVDAATLNS